MSKLFKRWIAVLMCFAMLLAVMPVTALAAESKDGTPVATISATYINPLYADVMDEADLVKPAADTQANDVEYCSTIEEAGAVVREQLKDRQETVTVGLQAEEMNQQQMRDVFSAALVHTGVPTEGDYLAWQYGGWSCSLSYKTQGSTYYLTMTYTVTYYTTAEQEAQVDAAVESLLSELALDGKSDYEAVKGVYDWICDNVTYDYDNLEDDSYKLKFTAYGALIDGTSVCQGYAVLLYRLALEQGVDCRFISGTGNGGAHGWNIIGLGGRYYNADSTWDAGRSSYSYFLVCDGNFSDHTRDEEYSTEAFYAAYPMGETDYDPNAVVENPSGTCGEGVTWMLDDAGRLTISGTGDMEDYSSSNPAPWKDYRDRIKSVVIEEGVARLGAYSFQDCTALTSASIPDGLVRNGYGKGAFQGCSSLTSVNIPDGVVVIYDYTFDGCSSLTTIDIPDSVSSVCMDAFTDCAARRTDEQGIVTVDTWVVAYTGSASEITIPAGITGIGLDAFCGCAGLTGVVFPDSLRYMNEEAFLNCTGLTEVDIPGQVTAIERFVFEGCSNLVSVHLPDGITIIDEDAFRNCERLTTINIPNSVTGIYGAFINCTSLAAIDLPEGLKTIGENAFYGCTSLTGVDIPGSVTEIGWGAFGNCSRLEEIRFYGDAPTIQEEAFSGVTATAYYPAGNETWTEEVRQNYGGTLTWTAYTPAGEEISGTCGENVTWTLDSSGLLTISGTGEMDGNGSPWSDYSDRIKSVVIEDGVTSISQSAFENCTNLASVDMADSVTETGWYAFAGCTSLTSVDFSEGLTSISTGVFSGCTSLAVVNLPESVTFLNPAAFENCVNLVEIHMPGVTGIGQSALAGCTGLSTVNLPEGLTGIYEEAFSGCTSLNDIKIPNSVITIEINAFKGCPVQKTDAQGFVTVDTWVVDFTGSAAEVTIPDGMVGIATDAFCDCGSLTAVNLPDGMAHFSYSAFERCTSLAAIDFPGSVTEIGWAAFGDCSSLEEIIFRGDAPAIEDGAFNSVTATVYYPAGNDTWTEEVMQDYGGTLTWVAQEQPVDNPFTDVQETDYYYDAVLWAYSNGITSGTSETMFSPEQSCTRGQVVTFIWRAMGEPEPTITENPFTDVKASEYYYEAVLWAYEQGIVAGKTETSFVPEDTVTRAQVVTFLWRMEGSPAPESTENPFKDVKETEYYYQAVLWAYENGITSGTSDTAFSPDNPCTRAQVVCFLYRDMG